jgi:hypothetical protein
LASDLLLTTRSVSIKSLLMEHSKSGFLPTTSQNLMGKEDGIHGFSGVCY